MHASVSRVRIYEGIKKKGERERKRKKCIPAFWYQNGSNNRDAMDADFDVGFRINLSRRNESAKNAP